VIYILESDLPEISDIVNYREAKFAAGLFATLVNGTLELETQLAPGDG
jgi:hypothetical protein